MPEIGDVVEMIVDKPERNLSVGIQGTIVHSHNNNVYEVELTNKEGETLDVFALNSEEFVLVWRAETQEWVPIAEQTVAIIKDLPDNIAKEVLDFACFLSFKHLMHHQIAG
ncbi:MAG: DUF4926 domain-containing protein [Thiomargarita sp.]|nr:DUF4926 domain-containing protein [Thiomargarita sp.]